MALIGGRHFAGWLPAAIGLVPVAIWLLGVFPMDVARVCAGLALVGVFAVHPNSSQPRWIERITFVLLLLVPAAIAAHLLIRLAAGLHGIDFAIFSQVVHSIANTGQATTSLLFAQPVNFLSHHFAPVLYAPGFVAALGVPAPVALVIASCASLLSALLALRRFCMLNGLQASSANAWALATALSVSVRPEMLWGVHDEVLALAFLGWSLVFLQQGHLGRSLLLLLLCSTAKESFFLVPPFWLVLALLERRTWGRWGMVCGLVALCWPLLGAAYVVAQPWLSGREFDHLNKFDWAFMQEHPLVRERLLFAVIPFLSLAFFPVFTKRAARWCLLGVPLFGLCLISSDPEMFRPTGYHAILPAVLIAFAGAVGLQSSAGQWLSSRGGIWVLVALQLSFGATSLWLPWKRVQSPAWYPAPELARLVEGHSVAADPAGVLVVLGSATPQRLWSVRAEDPPEFVVAKPDGYEPIPPWMDGQYTTVEVPPGWKVLRRKD